MKNENDVNKHYVLDTSAYFTLFEDEEGSDTVQNILEQAKVGDAIVFTSFVSLVHKDPEFDQLKEEIKLLHLPYKK